MAEAKAKSAAEIKSSAAKKEIIRTIRGVVAQRLIDMIPGLDTTEDAYATVMANPELLHGCMQLFRTKRDKFQDLLVDDDGNPVTDDDAPLRCERTVNQIVGMVVRSGAKAYAEKRFVTQDIKKVVHKVETQTLVQKLIAVVHGKWGENEIPKPMTANAADKFYAAIKDNLDFDWQVPLIPHYAELPLKLILELGKGLTALHTADGIATLANIGRHDMDEARRILSDDMMREMLDTTPLAAQGVAFLGKEQYEFLYSAVYEHMGAKFWEMCTDCDRLEAMEDKNPKDLEQMAPYLHIIGAHTINYMIQRMQHWQLPFFLEIANDKLGEKEFTRVFGAPGQLGLIKKFTEKMAAFKLDPGDAKTDFCTRLPEVFQAYLRHPSGFEKGL